MPAGFQPVSVTFVSPLAGWVLGVGDCGTQACVAIARTRDGGHTWQGIPAPRTTLSGVAIGGLATSVVAGVAPAGSAGAGVSGLRFADELDGWAFGPDLWATHDGGTTWHRISIPGESQARVVALEVSGGYAYAAVYPSASTSTVRIASSPVGTDAWTLSQVSVPLGAGPVPSSQLVMAGGAGWLLQVDRVVVAGAQIGAGRRSWTDWSPPCAQAQGPAVLGASDVSNLFAACDVGEWGGTLQGETLYASTDGGATFNPRGGTLPVQSATSIAAADPRTIFVGGLGSEASGGAALAGSFDGGYSWRLLLATGQVPITYVGFTTPTQGVAIAAAGPGSGDVGGASAGPGGLTGGITGTMYMTFDGGQTWSTVSFGGS